MGLHVWEHYNLTKKRMAQQMNATYSLDIANSKTWDNEKWLEFFRDRLVKMRAKRDEFDIMWDNYEQSINSKSFYDNNNTLVPMPPLEKDLIEIYEGRTNGKITYDIIPESQADIEQLQPSKYALQFFLDGNDKDNFWKENKMLRRNKATYGSGIFYTGIRNYKYDIHVPKADAEFETESDLQDESKFETQTQDRWFFFPKSIHPKDFYIDDGAYGQPDVQYADDCIMKEKLTATEFNKRYGHNPAFKNLKDVQYWTDIRPKNQNDKSIDMRYVILYHYFERQTGRYIICANEETLIFNSYFLYDDGKLPFVNIQHYTRVDRFRGEGIPERIGWIKAYKSELYTDILVGAQMANSLNFIVGNDDQLGQDWVMGGRQMNLWRTTGGAEGVQQVNSNINLGYFSSVMALLDQQLIVDSGINPLAQVEAQAPTLGQEELLEANKAVRNSSIDENYNIGLDEALTMTLARIKQFAPSLLSEKIKDSNGRVIKVIFPKIRVKGMEVKRKGGLQYFEESLGKYGYFDLKPDVIQGVGVKITTQSTNSLLPTLEKQKITDYINNMLTLGQLAQLDQTGGIMKQLAENIKFDDLMKWMNDAYGYDMNGLKAKTQKDKIFEQNKNKLEAMKEIMQNTLQLNAPTNVGPNTAMENQSLGGTTQPTQGIDGGIQPNNTGISEAVS